MLHAIFSIYSEGNKNSDTRKLKYSCILANMPDKQKLINSNNPDA